MKHISTCGSEGTNSYTSSSSSIKKTPSDHDGPTYLADWGAEAKTVAFHLEVIVPAVIQSSLL